MVETACHAHLQEQKVTLQKELEQKTAKRRAKRLKRKVCCHVRRAGLLAKSMAPLDTHLFFRLVQCSC